MNAYIPNAEAWRDYYRRQSQSTSQYGGNMEDIKSRPIITTHPTPTTSLTPQILSHGNESSISQRIEADMQDLQRLAGQRSKRRSINRTKIGQRTGRRKTVKRKSQSKLRGRKIARKRKPKRRSKTKKRVTRKKKQRGAGRKRASKTSKKNIFS